MAELTDAAKRKMISQLRKASKLHAGQADTLERSMMKKAKPKPKAKAKSKRGS